MDYLQKLLLVGNFGFIAMAVARPVSLAVGLDHACALTDKGNVRCWGSNEYEQTDVPSDLKNVKSIAAGNWDTCAVLKDGRVKCWGLYSNSTISPTDPFTDVTTAESVSMGNETFCAVLNEGFKRSIKCWGHDFPSALQLNNPTALASGETHKCAVTNDGIVCWSDHFAPNETLTAPTGLGQVLQISAALYHSCTLTKKGPFSAREVTCWGADAYGETQPPKLNNPRMIGVGYHHACALVDSGVRCWGRAEYGADPAHMPTFRNPRYLSAGGHHSCAIDDEGVKCWGEYMGEVPPLSDF